MFLKVGFKFSMFSMFRRFRKWKFRRV